MRKLICKCAMATAVLAGLAGCGGGGGGNDGSATTTAPAASADAGPTVSLFNAIAYQSQHGENRAFAVSGSRTDPNPPAGVLATPVSLSGNGMLSITPAVTAQFDGTPVLKSTQVISGTLVENGQTTPLDVTTVRYVDPRSLALVARIDDGVTTRLSSSPLPAAVHVGSNGVLGTGSSDALPVGVTTTSYAIGRDSASSVLLTVVDTVSVAGVPVTDVRTVTRLHLDGSAELVSITTERFNLGRLFETVTLSFA